jgi:ankyrin repeat protein
LTKGIIGGRTEIIEFLIQNGAKVNHAEHDGMRAMHKAALLGDVPMIELLAR